METPKYALSIRQPWAWLIAAGIKDVENRSWPTTKRGRIYVHAGMTSDMRIPAWRTGGGAGDVVAAGTVADWILDRLTEEQRAAYELARMDRGAIIGEVDIIACRYRHGEQIDLVDHPSIWHAHGSHGFYLEDAVLYDEPIPCKGRLGFFIPVLTANK